jgi:CelD/BcsL family acetyltransferase involved in cellulose biosynthesis
LMTNAERWDVLLLSEVPRSSPTLRALMVLAAAYGLPTGVWQSDDSPYVSTERSWEAYSATLSPAFRQNLRNRWARLAKLGSPELEVLEGREAIERGCADAIRLEASGWKQQQGTSIESESATRRFYTELAPRAAHAGWLRLLFLTVGGRRIATAYSGCFNNRLLFIKTGYDPEFAKCSPFKVLTHLAIRRAFETGMAEVDFLGTAEAWKLDWTRTTRPHDWLFLFGNTFRGRLVHQLKFRLKPALQLLQSAGRDIAPSQA